MVQTEPRDKSQLWEALLHQVQFDFYSSRYHRCTPDWSIVPRVNRDEMLHVQHRGEVLWRIGSEEVASGPGSVVFCPPHVEWEARRTSKDLVELTVIHFDAAFPGGQRYLAALGYPLHLRPDNIARIKRLGRDLDRCYDAAAPGHALQERALFTHLIYELFAYRGAAASMSEQAQQVLLIMQYLRDNLDQPVTREALAHRFHLSSGYLAELFKQYTGDSPIGYLLQLRLEKADRLLTASTLTVTEIARAVGYEDAAYFSRLYKKYAGVAPQQFRKEQRQLTQSFS